MIRTIVYGKALYLTQKLASRKINETYNPMEKNMTWKQTNNTANRKRHSNETTIGEFLSSNG